MRSGLLRKISSAEQLYACFSRSGPIENWIPQILSELATFCSGPIEISIQARRSSILAPIQAKLSHNQLRRHFSERTNGFDIWLRSKPNSAHRELDSDTKCMGLSVSDHRPSNRRRRLHSRCVFHRRKVTPAPHPLHFSSLRLALTVLTQVRWPKRVYSRALKSGGIMRHPRFSPRGGGLRPSGRCGAGNEGCECARGR